MSNTIVPEIEVRRKYNFSDFPPNEGQDDRPGVMVAARICTGCGEMKESQAFDVDKWARTGIKARCRVCMAEGRKVTKESRTIALLEERIRELDELVAQQQAAVLAHANPPLVLTAPDPDAKPARAMTPATKLHIPPAACKDGIWISIAYDEDNGLSLEVEAHVV